MFGRQGCCLCDEAKEILLRVRARLPFAFEERDIDADERLLRKYLERIPVVTINGQEVFELFVDEDQLERWLADPQPSSGP
jgi:glutaredoxin